METVLPNSRGTYVVILHNRERQSITAGRLGEMSLDVGYYLYVGSAFGPGGLRARLAHHLARSPRPHWHIDYLRRATEPSSIWFGRHTAPQEHRWATALGRGRGVVLGHARFGASDCRCASHLYFSSAQPNFTTFRRRLRSLGIPGGAETVPTDMAA